MSDNPSGPSSEEATSSSPTLNPVLPPPPTSTSSPTYTPTRSFQPSNSPTTPSPTFLPSAPPSSAPSVGYKIAEDEGFATQLFVSEERTLTDIEQSIFAGIVASHTGKIGLNLTEPFIKTECFIVDQRLGKISDNSLSLKVIYSMNYTSSYGYEEIHSYPEYFVSHMNENNGKTLDSLIELIDIIPAGFVIQVGNTAVHDLTPAITTPPTAKPTAMVTTKPSVTVSMSPSEMPSSIPSIFSAPGISTPRPDDAARSGYLVGILVTVVVIVLSTAIAVSLRFYRKNQRRPEDTNTTGVAIQHKDETDSAARPPAAQDQFSGGVPAFIHGKNDSRGDSSNNKDINASFNISIGEHDAEAGTIMTTPEMAKMTQQSSNIGSSAASKNRLSNNAFASDTEQTFDVFASDMAQKGITYPYTSIDSMISVGPDHRLIESGNDGTDGTGVPSSPQQGGAIGTFVGANLIATRLGSFSTDSFDETLSSQMSIGEGDEFDKYKNQVLEKLRVEAESCIDGVDGMLSMAITRVFMEDEDKALDISWIGGEDLGSIEASCLCQAFEWERKSETLASGRNFFEDMLNKIVFIVHHGLIRPQDGARILHSCASIVGLPLTRELPKTTLVIHGLVKTNDLARGHHMLVETFSPFGDIVDASIAPQNRGFGFVRFVQSKSVDAVLKREQMSEIEIQDVAVSIKTL